MTKLEEEKIILKVAERIDKYDLDVFAILFLGLTKPLSYVGAQLGRFFVNPFIGIFGEDLEVASEKLLQVFEKKENIDKLLSILEKLRQEKDKKNK